jgi:predicted outer membrane repeat protein
MAKKTILITTITLLAFCLNSGIVSAAIIKVPQDFKTIQEAINAAKPGDTVQVAAGTYHENVKMKDGVNLIGAGADVTTIDGDSKGSCVTAEYIKSETKLAGFTITDGKALEGGGVLIRWCSSLTIEKNVITSNTTAGQGGGIYCLGSSAITINENAIQNNSASGSSSGEIWGGGGGIYIGKATDITVKDNTIENNSTKDRGGGIMCFKSGVDPQKTPAAVIKILANKIKNNSSSDMGGGIEMRESRGVIVGNRIEKNSSKNGGGGICSEPEGTIFKSITPTVVVIQNNVIAHNRTDAGGGGILFLQPGVGNDHDKAINNTIVGNEARIGGGIHISHAKAAWDFKYCVEIKNNIIVANSSKEGGSGISQKFSSPPWIDYNNVWNNEGPKGDYEELKK